jgi:hypothetical protein
VSLSKEEHLASAQRFDTFLSAIPSQYAEWKVIVLFYSALHYVEAFLVTRSVAYRDHTYRDLAMEREPETQPIRATYNRLKKAAHEARYEGTVFRPGDVGEFQKMHETIRRSVLRALGLAP